MTVFIKSGELRLRFPVPLSILRLAPLVPDRLLPETPFDIRETSPVLYRALKQARRDFPGLELVHVWSADGDEVIVKL